LSAVNNLDQVEHVGPSTIGIDTLYKSNGKIPESFLRGCGVPDILITYLPSLVGPGIEFYSSFISYSHKDEEFAQRLHARMQQERLRVWFAPHDMLRWTHDTAEIVGEAVATLSRSPARATVVMMRASDTFLERPLAGSPGR